MPTSTVFWFGPVDLTQVPGATIPGAFSRDGITKGSHCLLLEWPDDWP
jgi:hypothetical protein